jgi:hypothetical protein
VLPVGQLTHVPTTLVIVHGGNHSLAEPGGQPTPKEIEDLVVDFFVKKLTPSDQS